MTTTMRRVLFLGLSVVVFVYTGFHCRAASAQLTAEDRELFAWYDSLGYESFATMPLVEVTTGWWSQSGNDPATNSTIHAFLKKNSGREFGVHTLLLTDVEFEITPEGTSAHEVVKFVPVDLHAYAVEMLEAHDARKTQDDDWFRRFGSSLSEAGEYFALARACESHDEPELAHRLLVASKELSDQSRDVSQGDVSLKHGLAEDYSNMEMWRAILEFGDPKVSRKTILKNVNQIVANFPDSRHFARAEETADLLKQMIEEEDKHVTPADFETLSTEDKVAELIFQLRDQNGQQWSQPGSCNVFSDDDFGSVLGPSAAETQKPSPAAQLVKLGFDAVPQLIEALDDKRFSRSVGYHRNFYFSHHVLRVGDCAEQTLARIANRSFYDRTNTNAAMAKDGEAATTKDRAEAWWNQVQLRGEAAVLADAVMSGGRNAPAQAERLVEKYPDEAILAIKKGLKNCQSAWGRSELLAQAAKLGDVATDLIEFEMKQAPELSTRVAAAGILLDRNPEAAVDAMIREWNTISAGQAKGPRVGSQRQDGVDQLIRLLATSNRVAAVAALQAGFKNVDAISRFGIVTAFGLPDGLQSSFTMGLSGGMNIPSHESAMTDSDEVVKAIELLLIEAMVDTTKRMGVSGNWGEISFANPRIGDVAGHVLTQRFPDKYQFDFSANFNQREGQRIATINVWRRETGVEPLPVFQPRKIMRLPTETTSPKLQQIIGAEADQLRDTAIGEFESLGIGGLPAVIEATAKLSDEHPAKQPLIDLAARLSNTVVLIRFSDDSILPDESFKQRVAVFENQPVSGKMLVELMTLVVKQRPKNSTGIKIEAIRNRALDGFELNLTLTKGWAVRSGSQRMWNTDFSMVVEGESSYLSSGSFSMDFARQTDAYEGFSESVDGTLESNVQKSIEIYYSLILDNR